MWLFLVLPFLGLGQVQIGQDIYGQDFSDLCGSAVVLSSDASVIAVSSPGSLGDNNGGNLAGQVRIFENIGGIWTQIGQDINGEAPVDESGESISLSSDGSIVAIGAIGNDGNGSFSGHVRVFENIGGTWSQIGEDIDGENSNDRFGSSVSLSSDGSKIAIGTEGNSRGYAKVYENMSGTWTQIGQNIIGEALGNFSGSSISLSSDGTIIAIGAKQNSGNGNNAGHVRVFENIGGTWSQIGQDIDGLNPFEQFGGKVSLSSDGSIVAISAISKFVRVYENIGGVWTQIGNDIMSPNFSSSDYGIGLELSSDGLILAIGEPAFDSFKGRTKIYKNILGTWTQIGNDIEGDNSNDKEGFSISFSSDYSVIATGSPTNNSNTNSEGRARVFNIFNLLSVAENNLFTFKIYPNPTKNQFTIELNPSVKLEKVFIYNTLGQLVLTSEEKTIDTSNLSSGSYIVELETNQGKDSKKLIID